MLGELLKVGDKVVVNIPDDNWNQGYRPVKKQNGTKVKVVGFTEIEYSRIQSFGRKPGIYHNSSWVYLEGIENPISSYHMELANQAEFKRRCKTFNREKFRKQEKMIRPLPDMKFWEGDIVTRDWSRVTYGCPDHWQGKELQIAKIEYAYLGQKRNDGSPMPEYSICAVGESGCTSTANESDIKLVRRGNIWKHYHGEKPSFKDLKEEITFAKMIGQDEQVRNYNTGMYSWTLKEVLNAIRDGKVDGFTADRGILGMSKELHHWAYKFKDRDLGERVRQETLKGFLQQMVTFDREDYEKKLSKGLCEHRGCSKKATWDVCASNGRSSLRCGRHKAGKHLTLNMRKIKRV